MERELPTATPVTLEQQIEALRQENATLRAQLVAMQQLALAPREPVSLARRRWVARGIQLLLVLFGMAAGATYMMYSDADFVRGFRDGAMGTPRAPDATTIETGR